MVRHYLTSRSTPLKTQILPSLGCVKFNVHNSVILAHRGKFVWYVDFIDCNKLFGTRLIVSLKETGELYIRLCADKQFSSIHRLCKYLDYFCTAAFLPRSKIRWYHQV
jgi:hypothetical protein